MVTAFRPVKYSLKGPSAVTQGEGVTEWVRTCLGDPFPAHEKLRAAVISSSRTKKQQHGTVMNPSASPHTNPWN